MDYMVETNDITKSYGDFTAVDSVNLKIPRDSVFGVLGP